MSQSLQSKHQVCFLRPGTMIRTAGGNVVRITDKRFPDNNRLVHVVHENGESDWIDSEAFVHVVNN